MLTSESELMSLHIPDLLAGQRRYETLKRQDIHTYQKPQIRLDMILLCVQSQSVLGCQLGTCYLKKKILHEISLREFCLVSSQGVCSVNQIPARCWRVLFKPSASALSGFGLEDSFRKQPERVEGRSPSDRFCASELFKLLLVPHILPFFRLAAIIFFSCKIFCKQPQKKLL